METPSPIGFAPPPIDEDTIRAVERVLRSGWITSGPELALFEQDIAQYLSVNLAMCFSSWTTACELALRWYGVGPGDEVILPVVTYAATANIVLHCGATPVLVDIDPSDRVATAGAIRAHLSSRTKAVMPVDLGGWPVDYAAIASCLQDEAVKTQFQANSAPQQLLGRPLFLADAAHSFGAQYEGKPVGSQADITGFSFHAVKNLTTAEGGALAFALPSGFDLDSIQKWFRSMALHGQSKSALEKTTSGTWHYDVVEAGYKCNMTDIQAAIGRSQLQKYPAQMLRRGEIVRAYHAGFSECDWYGAPPMADERRISSFHLFQMRIRGFSAAQRDALIMLLKEQGIATNVHFLPLPKLTLHKNRGEQMDNYPHAAAFFNETLSLPVHLALSDSDVERVIQAVKLGVKSVQSA